jgi:hypothetical protein
MVGQITVNMFMQVLIERGKCLYGRQGYVKYFRDESINRDTTIAMTQFHLSRVDCCLSQLSACNRDRRTRPDARIERSGSFVSGASNFFLSCLCRVREPASQKSLCPKSSMRSCSAFLRSESSWLLILAIRFLLACSSPSCDLARMPYRPKRSKKSELKPGEQANQQSFARQLADQRHRENSTRSILSRLRNRKSDLK